MVVRTEALLRRADVVDAHHVGLGLHLAEHLLLLRAEIDVSTCVVVGLLGGRERQVAPDASQFLRRRGARQHVVDVLLGLLRVNGRWLVAVARFVAGPVALVAVAEFQVAAQRLVLVADGLNAPGDRREIAVAAFEDLGDVAVALADDRPQQLVAVLGIGDCRRGVEHPFLHTVEVATPRRDHRSRVTDLRRQPLVQPGEFADGGRMSGVRVPVGIGATARPRGTRRGGPDGALNLPELGTLVDLSTVVGRALAELGMRVVPGGQECVQ